MPQVGYIKECKCKEVDFRMKNGAGVEVDCVDFGHYIKNDCHPDVPLVLAHALLDAIRPGRYDRTHPVVSGSMLNTCPLTLYYETHHKWVGRLIDPAFMLRGTIAHEGMLDRLKKNSDFIVETPRKLVVGGVEVFGTPDIYDIQRMKLSDLKTQAYLAIVKKLKQTDDEILRDPFVQDNRIQVNVYATMLRNDGYKVIEAELQYMDGVFKDNKSGKCRVRVVPVPLAEHEKMLAWIEPKAKLLQAVLDKTMPVDEIAKHRRVYKGWKPKTGVDYLTAMHP